MKPVWIYPTILTTILFFGQAYSQTPADLMKLLVQKGAITQKEADSIRQDYSNRKRNQEIQEDSFPLSLGRLLRLSGYTQVRFQDFQQKGKPDGFDIRRARLDFQGDFSTKWNYRLLIDFVGASGATGGAPTGGALIAPTLFDAFIAYKPFPFIKIQAGQFILPLSQENLIQDRNLELIDRSQVVNALVARKGDISNGLVDSIGNQNGRDIGVQLSGSLIQLKDGDLLDYYLGLFDGAGINTVDNNESKDICARIVLHPFKGLSLGSSYYNGFDRFTSSLAKDQERIRWGADLSYSGSRLGLRTEYLQGQEGNENPIRHQGWYAQGTYFIVARHLQGIFRYDSYNPNEEKAKQTNTYYVFGMNYFFNVWTKVQVNYSWRTESGPVLDNDVITIQLQLAF